MVAEKRASSTVARRAKTKKAEQYDVTVERPPEARWITMTNALTRAGQGLTLSEKRIVCCAVSKLDSRKPANPAELHSTRINAAEYAETFGVDMNTAYEQLQSAARHLYDRSITFFEPAHKRKDRAAPPTRVTMRWVGQVKYQAGEGWVELYWWPPLLPHLTGLKKNFTSYQLGQASALRSIYSWRLLELLTRFEDTGWLEVSVEDFCVSMDAPASLSDFGQVKRRILEPAVTELVQKDNWVISWVPLKRGRRVEAIRFDFERNPQHQLTF